MPLFKPGEPIKTETPTVTVEIDPTNPLPVGRHIFELVAVDDSGNNSAPATVEVIVRDSTAPTAVIDGPGTVEAGKPFDLSGARSTDVPPGKIISYIWTLRQRPPNG